MGQKTGLFLRAGNFATTNGRKAYNMSKFLDFVKNEMRYLHVSAVKYSLPNLNKSSIPPELH